MHARGMPDTKLRALGESHSRQRLDIRPELYDLWLDALLLTISEHDKECDADIRLSLIHIYPDCYPHRIGGNPTVYWHDA